MIGALYTITVNSYYTITPTLHYSLPAVLTVLYRPIIFHILLALVKHMFVNALKDTVKISPSRAGVAIQSSMLLKV
jgi:hypothetical protein